LLLGSEVNCIESLETASNIMSLTCMLLSKRSYWHPKISCHSPWIHSSPRPTSENLKNILDALSWQRCSKMIF